MKQNLPEAWLRGPIADVDPLLAPVIHSLQAAREDLDAATHGLTAEQIWARPQGVTPLGFHLHHIAESVDRLTNYLEGKQLSEAQMAILRMETEPQAASREELLSRIDKAFQRAEAAVRSVDPKKLTEPRAVGRKRLPTTVAGLLLHIAEHTQRHVGEALVAAKLSRARTEGAGVW